MARHYISLRSHEAALKLPPVPDLVFEILFDQDAVEDIEGPAAALLAAHSRDSQATWLVLACDFPLVTVNDLTDLIDAYEHPGTSFINESGFREPLLAIWSPEALTKLLQNVQQGLTGPSQTLRQLRCKTISAKAELTLLNANTPQEWQRAQRIISCMDCP